MKNRIILSVAILVLIVAAVVATVLLLDFETPDDYFGDDGETAGQDGEAVFGKVKITVECISIKDESAENIPNNGYIIEDIEIAINEGDTVLTVLKNAAKNQKIIVDDSQGYVTGIGGIYSGDFGDMSGWTYYVNGESPMVGAGEYLLSDKDEIKWVYIKDFSELWG